MHVTLLQPSYFSMGALHFGHLRYFESSIFSSLTCSMYFLRSLVTNVMSLNYRQKQKKNMIMYFSKKKFSIFKCVRQINLLLVNTLKLGLLWLFCWFTVS